MSAHPVLVVMGVSGSGKSTVAALLAGQLGWDYLEGDDLHPAANVAKMSAGIPLNDEDRWPWLLKIADWIGEHEADQMPGVVTCSALKRSYRDRLRQANVIFVYLAGSKQEISERLSARHGHFMPPALLDSQFEALEPPAQDEAALTVQISHSPVEEAAEIIQRLRLSAS
ncbi:carbohydrate kinase (thermoresistant glucokinase family) [Psychromicrobium silvestre]|uniref:Gluconokinase n=1 Tax=Psychromicrobium silvestre TaxID=1645614 RepID=A0A7Y9LRK1_9MICC|nr:gluconokinase [Psychromicrobium silvestre]NYE94285.1 carbohydrate kinase (thermoresistant glucokinase family) [Psychromicrobium silvestre]